MEAYANVISVGILFFVVLILIEWGISISINRPVNRIIDTVSSLSSGITNVLKDILKLTVVILSYDWMYQHLAIFEIASPFWLYALAFIGLDFVSYWSHRWKHEYNILWNQHIIHHSSEEYNLSCALRQQISGIIGIFFFLFIPMAIIGIKPEVVAIVAPLHLFAQFWYHTQLIGKMGILEYIIMTPSHHRVHHAINKEYLDKNYAAIFIVWDKWFGTFQEELDDVPPVYGVKKPVKTWNPFIINFMHLWQLIKDAWRTKSWYDKARIWFMPTGWRPADVAQKYPIDVVEEANTLVKYDPPASLGLKVWALVQLVIHNLFLLHAIGLLPTSIGYSSLLLYGIFIMVSIFAYTTLLDRHPQAVYAELVKTLTGFALLILFNGWFILDSGQQIVSYLMAFYLIMSLAVSIYFTYFDIKQLQEVNSY